MFSASAVANQLPCQFISFSHAIDDLLHKPEKRFCVCAATSKDLAAKTFIHKRIRAACVEKEARYSLLHAFQCCLAQGYVFVSVEQISRLPRLYREPHNEGPMELFVRVVLDKDPDTARKYRDGVFSQFDKLFPFGWLNRESLHVGLVCLFKFLAIAASSPPDQTLDHDVGYQDALIKYLHTIPHDPSKFPLNNLDDVVKHIDLVKMAIDLYPLRGFDPWELEIQSLQLCSLEPLSRLSTEYQEIKTFFDLGMFFPKLAPAIKNYYVPPPPQFASVAGIYSIERAGEKAKHQRHFSGEGTPYNPDQRYLLWHGTPLRNLQSILRTGLHGLGDNNATYFSAYSFIRFVFSSYGTIMLEVTKFDELFSMYYAREMGKIQPKKGCYLAFVLCEVQMGSLILGYDYPYRDAGAINRELAGARLVSILLALLDYFAFHSDRVQLDIDPSKPPTYSGNHFMIREPSCIRHRYIVLVRFNDPRSI